MRVVPDLLAVDLLGVAVGVQEGGRHGGREDERVDVREVPLDRGRVAVAPVQCRQVPGERAFLRARYEDLGHRAEQPAVHLVQPVPVHLRQPRDDVRAGIGRGGRGAAV